MKDMTIDDAFIFASTKHAGQKRKDGTAYIYHPVAVAKILKDAGYDETYQITALLHDTLEDTDTTEEEISQYGDDVLTAVKLLTRDKDTLESDYINAILGNKLAATIKNADRLHNLSEAIERARNSEKARTFLERYVKNSEEYYSERFTDALDDMIAYARNVLIGTKKPDRCRMAGIISPRSLRLKADAMKEDDEARYQRQRARYLEGVHMPDLASPALSFFTDGIEYYCAANWPGSLVDPAPAWCLTDGGWVEFGGDLVDIYEDLWDISRESARESIKKLISNNFFRDFVEEEKILP